jgi:hypothetical protein
MAIGFSGTARDSSPVALEFMSKIDMNSMSASFDPVVSDWSLRRRYSRGANLPAGEC